MKKLGFGLMRLPLNNPGDMTDIDIEQLERCGIEYFNIYNTLHQFGRDQQWLNTSVYYGVLNKTHGKASDCIECGQCEEHCPQHIQIIDNLNLVAQTFQ